MITDPPLSGDAAASLGFALKDNPFKPGTSNHFDWDDAWSAVAGWPDLEEDA